MLSILESLQSTAAHGVAVPAPANDVVVEASSKIPTSKKSLKPIAC